MIPLINDGDAPARESSQTGFSHPLQGEGARAWDTDTYRWAMKFAPFVKALPPCEACGQREWHGDGKGGGSYRLKCGGATQGKGICGKTTAASKYAGILEPLMEAAQKEIKELRVYLSWKSRPAEAPKNLTVLTPKRQRSTPPPPHRMEQETPQGGEWEEALAQIKRELQKEMQAEMAKAMEAMHRKYEEKVKDLTNQVATLKLRLAQSEGRAEQPQQEVKLQRQPNSTPQYYKTEAGKSFAQVVKAGGQEWQVVGTKKKKPTETRAEKAGPQGLTEAQVTRMMNGERSRPTGLEWVHVEGLKPERLATIRALLRALGISTRWVRHLDFAEDGTLEMLVYKEHAAEIKKAIRERKGKVHIVEDPDTLPTDRDQLRALEKRMEKNIQRTHEDAHLLRRELRTVQKMAAEKRQSLEKMEVEVEGEQSARETGTDPTA
jgi:hypothetical protein